VDEIGNGPGFLESCPARFAPARADARRVIAILGGLPGRSEGCEGQERRWFFRLVSPGRHARCERSRGLPRRSV